MRIGEVARRTGVPAATLRVWERRYGVLQPARTEGGHRRYTGADVVRVRALLARIETGRSVGSAARELLAGEDVPPSGSADVSGLVERAWRAVEAFDVELLRRVLADGVAALGVAGALDDLAAPVLRRLGAEWRLASRNVAREHFASTVVRSHAVGLLPGSGLGDRPRCVGFCPEGELHDIGLVMAGAALADVGWQAIVLGAHTPWASVEAILEELRPDAVLIGAQRRPPVVRMLEQWSQPGRCLTVLGGSGFKAEDALRISGAVRYDGPYSKLGLELEKALGEAGKVLP